MSSFLGMIQMLVLCGTVLTITFFVLLSLPNSKLRAVLMPIVGWGMAIFCAVYCISPVDICPEALLGPFGLIDDIGAVFLGYTAAKAAMNTEAE